MKIICKCCLLMLFYETYLLPLFLMPIFLHTQLSLPSLSYFFYRLNPDFHILLFFFGNLKSFYYPTSPYLKFLD